MYLKPTVLGLLSVVILYAVLRFVPAIVTYIEAYRKTGGLVAVAGGWPDVIHLRWFRAAALGVFVATFMLAR